MEQLQSAIENNNLIKNIVDSVDKYKNDQIMTQKITTLLKNIPNTIEQIKKREEKRQNYYEEMNTEQEKFIKNFLANNQYYYLPNEDRFFYYDNKHYIIENEENISHKIITNINNLDGVLHNWKFKTSVSIMKLIKDKHIFKCIPESFTLQFVLNKLYPLFFKSKEEVKYFLTIIGDNVLKKNKDIHYFVNSHVRLFLENLNQYSNFNFGNIDCIGNIKTKYYEHDFNNSRIINTQKSIENKDNWLHLIKNHTIDIIIVSCHYSNRYKSAELYLQNMIQTSALDRITYLKKNNQEKIIDNFINEYVEVCNKTNYTVTWKNMQFLWKQFLNIHQLPSIIYTQQLKAILTLKLEFDLEKDEFTNIISKYLPKISFFLDFFNQSFTKGNEIFEISEIKMLYEDYIKENKFTHLNIFEEEILEVISYFSSEFEIENDKKVHGLSCIKWNKKQEIENSINNFMMQNLITNYDELIPYECYEYYINHSKNKYLVNKDYFIDNMK